VEIAAVAEPLAAVEAGLLAVPVAADEELAGPAAEIDAALGGALARLAADGELTGKTGEVTLLHPLGRGATAARVAAVGVGKRACAGADELRTAASRIGARATSFGGTVAWAVDPGLPLDAATQGRAVAEGLVLGSHDAGRWKSTHERRKPIERLLLAGGEAPAAEDAARTAHVSAEWTNRCRDLVNAPANELTPVALAERASELAAELAHVRFEALGPAEIRERGMGAFVSVFQGSDTEPRLIVLEYEPPGARDDMVLGLVGKAITFDSGGLSLKPAARMDEMKSDMGGGGAALCGLAAVAALEIPLRVTAVVPACENMPSGHATRPGDIVRASNGKTIEITNTDAEGRLVLADALVHARERGATHLLDLATLTGAVVVALGDFYAGLLGNDEAWVSTVRDAAETSGDHAWVLPLHDTYKRLFRSPFADMKNSSDLRQAGPVYAGSFLAEFAGEGPWAHLDIAGTAFLTRGRDDYYTARGATGYGVRLIAELARGLTR
jgi:leucyl aminopeptidase